MGRLGRAYGLPEIWDSGGALLNRFETIDLGGLRERAKALAPIGVHMRQSTAVEPAASLKAPTPAFSTWHQAVSEHLLCSPNRDPLERSDNAGMIRRAWQRLGGISRSVHAMIANERPQDPPKNRRNPRGNACEAALTS